MWCPTCKADVAAEVAADNRRVRCATCGGEIPVPAGFAGLTKTREARELLERWASERQTDSPPTRTATSGNRSGQRASRTLGGGGVNLESDAQFDRSEPQDDSHSLSSSRRFDAAEPLSAPMSADVGRRHETSSSASSTTSPRGSSRHDSVRVHHSHHPTNRSDAAVPTFDIQGSLLETDHRKTNWTYIFGQLLAYAGVALLTVGSTLVLWGYFGGPPSYAPTGWLTTMAGQMLLILGVVTLVSGGMEQTNEDVRTRIERLGERMIRIEQIARDHALRGPTVPADYARAQAAELSSRQD